MAAYGAWRKQGKSDRQAQAYLLKLFRNVSVQDKSARDSLQTFASGKGDVLLAYENEALFARTKGQNLAVPHPDADDPDREPRSRCSRTARTGTTANEFLRFLRTPAAQRIFAENGFRPVVKSVAAEYASKFPTPTAASSRSTARARRLGHGPDALLRPEERDHGQDRTAGRGSPLASDAAAAAGAGDPRREGGRRPPSRLGVVHAYLTPIVAAAAGCARLASRRARGRRRFWDAVTTPAGGRRAEAHARRVARRRARQRGRRDADRLGARARRLPRQGRRQRAHRPARSRCRRSSPA